MIDGIRAKELGVVLETCEQSLVLERALAIARSIADCSPVAVRAVTKTLRDQHANSLQKAIEVEAFSQVSLTLFPLRSFINSLTPPSVPDLQ